MKLRNQLILAFLLFSVAPLTGVTLFSYYSSLRAFRQTVETEAGALARDMERRMGRVTVDLQHRIDRLSDLPDWASVAPGTAQDVGEWNALALRLQRDLGSAAGLVKQLEFTPAEAPRPGGDRPSEQAPSLVLIQMAAPTDVEQEFVAERVGHRVVLHRRGGSIQPAAAREQEPGSPGEAPGAIPAGPRAGARSPLETLNQGLLALSRELSARDRKRRAGIDVPVAEPEEFEFLLASEIGSTIRQDGKMLGTVRARVSTRELLRRVLSRTRRERGEVPFALDAEGNLYTPDPADLAKLESLHLPEQITGAGPSSGGAPDPGWVSVLETDSDSGLTFGIARPVGESLHRIRTAAATNLAMGLALVSLALGGILPLTRRMTRNLDRLSQGAERLAGGNLEARVPVRSRDEFGRLAGTFNRMARQLGEHQRRLLEQERLRRELELCRQIQDELLPSGTYRSPHVQVTGISIPARELGGDFFNYFPLAGGELGILVGDVSGKGVAAALLMANIQATLRARLPVERDLSRLVDSLDRDLGRNTPDEMYLTLFLGILDPDRKELRYVNAGHTPPLAVHRDGSVERLVPCGRPPGLVPGGGYREEAIAMKEEDSLFLYTDGLVEAEDIDGQSFGVERLQRVLVRERHLELEALLDRVRRALQEHQGRDEAADDATLVALKVPAGAPAPATASGATTGTGSPACR